MRRLIAGILLLFALFTFITAAQSADQPSVTETAAIPAAAAVDLDLPPR